MSVSTVEFRSDDPLLSAFTELTDVEARRVREPAEGIFIAEGLKVITRAKVAGFEPLRALTTSRWVDGIAAVVGDIPIHVGTEDELQSITGYRVHRGALVAYERPVDPGVGTLTATARRLFVLEDLKEHTNVGAIVRNAAAFGVDGLVISPECADPLYRRSIKVSMGTVFSMPWTRPADWWSALADLKSAGFVLAALTPAAHAVDIRELAADPPDRLAWLLGTEGPGLSDRAFDTCDLLVRIPMEPGIDSLNVAAAAAVAAFATATV